MNAVDSEHRETARLELQARLDGKKSQAERNRLGQFATPTQLARTIVRYSVEQLGERNNISFLDPAFGTGAFYSALLSTVPPERVMRARAFEIDPHYAVPTKDFWSDTSLQLRQEDFTSAAIPSYNDRYDLIVCNPPYVRHHHLTIDEKQRLSAKTLQVSGVRVGGLAGLYCYFMTLCHDWMSDDAVAVWLVPSEFMDVVYGGPVKQYLLKQVSLERIHRFDPADVQFGDALVSSAVVWFRRRPPMKEHVVRFTYGGTIESPAQAAGLPTSVLENEAKWSRFPLLEARVKPTFTLGDFFSIKRGVATGGNSFFILTANRLASLGISKRHFRPILPSPRDLATDFVDADALGEPMLDSKRYLLNCTLGEDELASDDPALHQYLMSSKQVFAAKYLCSKRNPWYAQEARAPAPILSTYMGRGSPKNGRPFRFILNRSNAIAANVYLLLYPKPLMERAIKEDKTLLDRVWQWLNTIDSAALLGEGRVYGGGLYKLEPRELGNLPAEWLAGEVGSGKEFRRQGELFGASTGMRDATQAHIRER